MIQSHAALHQMQRSCITNEPLTIEAVKADYAAIYELLQGRVLGMEEELSPAAMELITSLQQRGMRSFTVKQLIETLAWSYSKCYRTLKELTVLNLIMPDKNANGIERNYEVAPFTSLDHHALGLPSPKVL